MSGTVKRVFAIISIVILVVLLVVGGYVVYLVANYSRIGESALDVSGDSPDRSLTVGQEYRALSWNIGFGAYAQDYSFFMDESILRKDVEGVGKAGDKIAGESSTAKSKESAEALTQGVVQTIESLPGTEPDFLLLQEVDTNSHRSFRVDQCAEITSAQAESTPQSVFANNFHSVWLQYPIFNPIGDIQSGLLTSSAFTIEAATRFGYPIDESFPTKFFDLDRCYSASYIPVENSESQLVIINSHMTAYSSSNDIRTQQLQELMNFAQNEYDKGNYVVIGGDFNQVFSSDPEQAISHWQNAIEIPAWVGTLDKELVGDDFELIYAENEFEVSTCRDPSFSYRPGDTYEVVIDGFIVSRNVSASSQNLAEDFRYSDHNPVLLDFTLLSE